ncbi:hypothetical protein GOBAR_AA18532 [Gossypium barbadense]|uniref:Uncharacterized protein n=1 Tax=Gossypium barbadense TaxID=3634 RepID=A0A2P5XFL6_GOSBA|nr:hypothetical protein GOBAR_AA18532 [Gossypium barbadense]
MAPGDNPRLKEKKDDEGTRHARSLCPIVLIFTIFHARKVKFPLPSAPVPESCSKRGEGLLSVVYLVVEATAIHSSYLSGNVRMQPIQLLIHI